MDSILNLLMEQAYELEGLLLVAKSRDDSSQKYLYELINKKSAKITELAANLLSNKDGAAELKEPLAAAQTFEAVQGGKPVPEPESESEPESEPAETEASLTADNPNFPDALQWLAQEQTPESTTIPQSPTPLQEPEIEAEADIEQPEYVNDDNEDDKFLPEQEEEEQEEEEQEEEDSLTVDQALQRKLSRDLHHAFSLNDRFRFRRELFANNDVELNDTLNLVETMQTFEEAEDFFYNDLEWDKDSPEVIDFMNIIRNHFYNKGS